MFCELDDNNLMLWKSKLAGRSSGRQKVMQADKRLENQTEVHAVREKLALSRQKFRQQAEVQARKQKFRLLAYQAGIQKFNCNRQESSG